MPGQLYNSGSVIRTSIALAAVYALAMIAADLHPSWALSEIKRDDLPPIEAGKSNDPDSGTPAIPLPVEPAIRTDDASQPDTEDLTPNDPVEPPETMESDLPDPEILTDPNLLPTPARRMRELILEACKSGDIEALRPLIGSGAHITQLSLGGLEGDPVNFLREISGDGEGHEILAILEEVLEAGFVRMDEGTPHEIYVWPYFFAYSLDRLDPRQRVELFRIVTAGDYEDMKLFGGYNFYRAGITPEGQWAFFVAGD